MPIFNYKDNCKNVDWKELSNLYSVAPLGDKPAHMLQIAFANSRYVCFVYHDSKLVGVGRALADGVDSAYLCDIALLPEYQGKGLGKEITQKLLSHVKDYNKIILFANIGKEHFYQKLGFAKMNTAMAIFKKQEMMIEKGFLQK
jgi:ribosomal protein S18 acetylase RimI-like enzyme